ncbi:protein spinster homolog 1 [Microcaecilia unicolor]|uniref:Protein spinster homolog 1 n=1 Tax=Microcaecilia unicolor TaxID=1415580 RepID=A0A6P7YJZ4_9AMPH|nr:protein spinster homolog 1 [Microcaecilia unicolor]XP_030065294.1 protein spinster homolog 1 [Microcaecilia unicolor]
MASWRGSQGPSDTAPFLTKADDTEEAESGREPYLGDYAGTPRSQQDGERDTDKAQVEIITGISFTHSVAIVVVLFFVNLLNYMDRFTVAGVLPDIEHFFNIEDSTSGLLQTVFICSYMVLAPIFGYLGDRYNRKYIMCCGIFFWAVVTLCSSFTPKEHFWLLLLTRGLVGVGEASYSTIAPTIIADLFVLDLRSRMLSIFYFAIPVGSGLGYIVGSQVKNAAGGDWHWALRVTPGLGLLAVVLLLFVVKEPPRGAVERKTDRPLVNTSWLSDVRALSKNCSFILSTLGFTSVAFVTGSLALWAPTYLFRSRVVQKTRPPCLNGTCNSDDSLIFGIITCVTGILGVGTGVEISKRYRKVNPRADPLVCAFGLLSSAPFLFFAVVSAEKNTIVTYVFIFLGETLLSLNWAIVADILLYVVIPTRRSTAEAFQIVISHLLGDAGSPYLIGTISDQIRQRKPDSYLWQFRSLEYALMLCSFVGALGGGFFLAAALFIEKDRQLAEQYSQGGLTEEEKIVVPGRGRSTKVPVSSVLI